MIYLVKCAHLFRFGYCKDGCLEGSIKRTFIKKRTFWGLVGWSFGTKKDFNSLLIKMEPYEVMGYWFENKEAAIQEWDNLESTVYISFDASPIDYNKDPKKLKEYIKKLIIY